MLTKNGDLDLLNITSTDLETWANFPESRAQLPQLIEKLILATAPDVLKCRIPYGDDIVQPGYLFTAKVPNKAKKVIT